MIYKGYEIRKHTSRSKTFWRIYRDDKFIMTHDTRRSAKNFIDFLTGVRV